MTALSGMLKRVPQPQRNGEGGDDPGPRNLDRDRQNPDLLAPPPTDHGTLPNMKFSFSDSHNRLEKGGWAREVSQRELPISTAMTGVNMRLLPGAFRELHWHKQAEWSYMLSGRARITAVDENGRNFIDDVGAGDLWYFPPGIPHSIQALREGCEFLLVFNDGNFSESGTFLLTDWVAHIPRDALAANFGVDLKQFSHSPESELYIFEGRIPGSLESEAVPSPYGPAPHPFSYRLHQQPAMRFSGGFVRIADSTNFAASEKIAAALVDVEPGGMRELHWHPNSDEWQYYISGTARMTVFAAEGRARTFDFQPGDVGYVPFAMGHYVQNNGTEPLRFLEVFTSDRFADISLNQWLALTPPSIVEQHLRWGGKAMATLNKEKRPVVRFGR